uniref:Uncharacterized protein n=1 Tax=Myotis myotis TaxID=51298 RepID=A0A7J8ALN8_MYOMY|nr:hypothetical protein mMyoMyo1_007803 [Myotis myotis]
MKHAPVSRSHAAWVVLRRTPALGAEAATLSDRPVGRAWAEACGRAETRGLSPGVGWCGPCRRVCEVPREASGNQQGVARVRSRRPVEPHPVCPGRPARESASLSFLPAPHMPGCGARLRASPARQGREVLAPNALPST